MVYFRYILSKLNRPRYILGSLTVAVLLMWAAVFSRPDGNLHLTFYNVGQGDAILINTPTGKDILVDGGPGSGILAKLSSDLPFYQRSLDVVVSTHPHADHISGLIKVLERYQVERLVLNPFDYDSGEYLAFLEAVAAEGAEVWPVEAEDKILLEPGLALEVVGPSDTECAKREKNVNNCSIALEVSYGDFTAFLTGDTEVEGQFQWKVSPATVFKAPHQGASNGFYAPVFEKVSPELVVVSVGKNSFGHPAEKVLGAYQERGVEYLRTDEVGDVEIVTDGKRWWYTYK